MIDSSDVYAVECAGLAIGLSALGVLYAYRWLQRLRPGFSCGTPLAVALAVRITAVLAVAALGATGEDLRGPDDPAFLDEASRLADGSIGADWLTNSRGDALSAVLALRSRCWGSPVPRASDYYRPGSVSWEYCWSPLPCTNWLGAGPRLSSGGSSPWSQPTFSSRQSCKRRRSSWSPEDWPWSAWRGYGATRYEAARSCARSGSHRSGCSTVRRCISRCRRGPRVRSCGVEKRDGRRRAATAAVLAAAAVGVGGLLFYSSWGDARLARLQFFRTRSVRLATFRWMPSISRRQKDWPVGSRCGRGTCSSDRIRGSSKTSVSGWRSWARSRHGF